MSLVSRGVLPTITMTTSDCRARATALAMSEPLLYVTVAAEPIFASVFLSPCSGRDRELRWRDDGREFRRVPIPGRKRSHAREPLGADERDGPDVPS